MYIIDLHLFIYLLLKSNYKIDRDRSITHDTEKSQIETLKKIIFKFFLKT